MPLRNPVGFGAVDFIELALVVLVAVLLVLKWPKFAHRTGWCMAGLAVLPVVLRLLLLPHYPFPTPEVSDDFSYLLVADTLLHGRLANPPHPMARFFETDFELQDPTHSSIFPLGQGIALAAGRALFGNAWAGVALSIGAFCALCYWMLRGWVAPEWALLGGLLAVIEFGPLNQWMNSFWGGAVSGCAGCLVYGALPRLRAGWARRDAVLLGAGVGVQLLTRPFEAVIVAASVVLFLLPVWRRSWRPLGIAVLAALPALALIVAQNKAVTGSWATMPYMLSRYQYGVPTTFTFQPNPTPHRELTPEQRLDYEAQAAVHGPGTDTVGSYLARLGERVRYYRFFFLPALYLALPFFVPALRERRYAWVGGTLALFALGTNFYPYFYSHYIAAASCLLLLMAVVGLQRMGPLARWVVVLCFAHFLFWYGVHAVGDTATGLTQYETWDAINSGDPQGRRRVNAELDRAGGQHLVFVRYGPGHLFDEWVHNGADIDAARVVWARDLGDENRLLRAYYPKRTAWIVEPDAKPVRVTKLE